MALKPYYLILAIAVFVTVIGCSGSKERNQDKGIPFTIQIKKLLEKSVLTDSVKLETQELMASYYEKREYLPVWTTQVDINNRGIQLLRFLENIEGYGLPKQLYRPKAIENSFKKNLAETELLLTNAFFLTSVHLSKGFLDADSANYVFKSAEFDQDFIAHLNSIFEDSVANVITANEPQFWEYEQLKKGLSNFIDKYPLDTNKFNVPTFKEDSVLCLSLTRSALLKYGFLDSLNAENDSLLIIAIKDFQKMNGLEVDGIVGKWTSRKLNQSNAGRFYQAALALEKWRWKKSPYPSRYIRVNIPEYNLYFFDSSSLKQKHRVIVGDYLTQTPEFSAEIKTIITYPYWHVPYSISSKEILPHLKKDSAYLRKHNYKIFKNGAEIDPTTVNWSKIRQTNFPYKVRQEGGSSNSLGKIKFLFPNDYFVFIHDTPGKRLFSKDIRAFSHGCVRLDKPFDLAKAILTTEENLIVNDTLDSIVKREEQRVIKVNKKFMVHMDYITVVGDSSDNIIVYPDIYGRDEKYTNTIKKLAN